MSPIDLHHLQMAPIHPRRKAQPASAPIPVCPVCPAPSVSCHVHTLTRPYPATSIPCHVHTLPRPYPAMSIPYRVHTLPCP
eukprot:351296-Chlamydomonas_euryale.AAC.2